MPDSLRSLVRRSVEPVLRRGPAVSRRGRRLAFIARAQARAIVAGGSVHLDVAADADISPSVDIDVWGGTETSVVIGPGAKIGDHVRLSLRGGLCSIGAGTDVRRFGTYNIGGRFTVGDGVVLSNGVCVHCAREVTIADLTIIGEYTTIADSAHTRTPPGVPVHHHVRVAQASIGSNVWVGAHAVIASGVSVGDQAFVGAGAVVTRSVEPGWLVAGVPAQPVRLLNVEAAGPAPG